MIGLVLEGGGAKGAYHAGAYKALVENDIQPSAVVGTSVGALNGALIAQGDWEVMYELWDHMALSKVLDVDDKQIEKIKNNNFSFDSFQYLAKYLQKSLETDGLDTSRLRSLLESIINETKLRESPVDFGLVTVSLSELKPYELFKKDIPTGQIIDYLMASSNFPIFKRQVIDGKKFIDGGIYDNTPVDLLKKKKITSLIVIQTKGLGINQPYNKKGLDIKTISPSRDLGGTLDFSEETCKYNLKLGYYDALKTILKLNGREYYFHPINDEILFMKELMQTPSNIVLELAELLHIPTNYSHGRMIFEGILPKLAELLSIPHNSTYEEIIEITCEEVAKKLKLDHFKIYTLHEMIEQIKKRYKKTPKSVVKKWLSFPLGHEVFIRAFKDQIVEKVILKVIQPSEDFMVQTSESSLEG